MTACWIWANSSGFMARSLALAGRKPSNALEIRAVYRCSAAETQPPLAANVHGECKDHVKLLFCAQLIVEPRLYNLPQNGTLPEL